MYNCTAYTGAANITVFNETETVSILLTLKAVVDSNGQLINYEIIGSDIRDKSGHKSKYYKWWKHVSINVALGIALG